MTQDNPVPVPVADYELGRWTELKRHEQDAFMVRGSFTNTQNGRFGLGVMLGLKDYADTAITTLTVEQARGLATLLLYQAKLSEERNNA